MFSPKILWKFLGEITEEMNLDKYISLFFCFCLFFLVATCVTPCHDQLFSTSVYLTINVHCNGQACKAGGMRFTLRDEYAILLQCDPGVWLTHQRFRILSLQKSIKVFGWRIFLAFFPLRIREKFVCFCGNQWSLLMESQPPRCRRTAHLLGCLSLEWVTLVLL